MRELSIPLRSAVPRNRGPNLAPRAKSGPRKFGAVAKLLWRKPAAAVADIESCSLTTAKRILRGDAEVSINLMLAAVAEMLRPID